MIGIAIGIALIGAIVTGPLFSLTASGQIAKALVYSTWKGRAYVREYVVGANPNTLAQRTRRVMMGFLSKLWALMDTTEQESWVTEAAAKNISPFNAMVGANMDRQTNELAPAANSTPAGGALTGTLTGLAITGGVGKITAVVTNAVNLAAGENNLLTISDVSSDDSESTMNSAAIGLDAASDGTFEITDLEPGTYYMSGAVFNQGGTLSAFLNSTPASVTVT